MAKRTVRDVNWAGKRALVRVDFNVPFERGTTRVSDDVRIRAALPTIQYLREQGAAVVLATHLGRPGGEPQPELELGPVAERLAELLGAPVTYVHDAVGDDALGHAQRLGPGDVLLLENVRFYAGEEANSDAFALALAHLADVYVNDAFGTAHRAHASTEGVAHHLVGGEELAVEVVEHGSLRAALGVGGEPEEERAATDERLVVGGDAARDALHQRVEDLRLAAGPLHEGTGGGACGLGHDGLGRGFARRAVCGAVRRAVCGVGRTGCSRGAGRGRDRTGPSVRGVPRL